MCYYCWISLGILLVSYYYYHHFSTVTRWLGYSTCLINCQWIIFDQWGRTMTNMYIMLTPSRFLYRSFWRVSYPVPIRAPRRSTFLNLFPSNFISFGLYDLFLGGFSITPHRSFGFFFSTAAFVDDKVCIHYYFSRARPLLVGAVAARLVLV